MLIRTYTIPGVMHLDDMHYTPSRYVFIFVCDPYRETNKLHQYQKRRRVWATSDDFRNGLSTGKHRTRQVERWCQLSGFKCEVTTE